MIKPRKGGKYLDSKNFHPKARKKKPVKRNLGLEKTKFQRTTMRGEYQKKIRSHAKKEPGWKGERIDPLKKP